MTAAMRALAYLVFLSFKRQARSKKIFLCLAILAFLIVVVAGVGALRPWSARSFGNLVVLRLVGLFYLPIVTLVFGTAAVADEREDGTLPYLFSRPLPRWGIFTGKLLAVLPIALALTVGGTWMLHRIAVAGGDEDLAASLGAFLPAIFLGSLAYLALFHLLGASFRHSTLIAIAYVFFIEVFLGRIPGILKRVSVSFYTWSMVYDAGAPLGIEPPARAVFLPVGGEVAARVLVIAFCTGLLLGAVVFSRCQYGTRS